jgi:hypothetical protein
MRALTSILFATTTLLSGLAATTASAAGPAAPQATAQQMEEIEGHYALSDGRRARIFVMDSRLYLELGRHYKELEPAGQDSWVTRDRSLSLQFRQDQAANQIVLHYRDDLPDAAPIRLAAREQRGRGGID